MAVTLTQSAYYTQNKLHKGIVDQLIKESPVLARIPFIDIVGNALAINREDPDNPPSVNWRQVNGVWTESTGDIAQVPFSLKILGGDADVDNFLQRTRSNVNDIMATQVKMKTKQMAHEFEDCFVYGVASGSNEFDGLHALMAAGQMVHAGTTATGAALTTILLDQLVDLVLGGKPDMILMNRNIRRRLSVYLRTVGSYQTARDDYGRQWMVWGDDIPILTSDWLLQTETIDSDAYALPTTGACSSIFAIRFGEGDGLCGIQNGGIETEVFDKLETKDAMRTRIKWYLGMALYSPKAIARIDGVTDAAMSA